MVTGQWATPGAVLAAPYATPRERWLELRREGIGGSDALAVLGLDPWKTRMEVYLDKTGQLPEREATDAMAWGSLVEAAIADWFTARTGIATRRCGLLRSVARPWQQVSVDRLTADGGVLEIKNTGHWRRREWDDNQVADGAEAQGQHALAVTGRSHMWFAAQIGGQAPVFRRAERDDTMIADMNAIEGEFWQLVLDRTPPALDGGAKASGLIARIYPQATAAQAEIGEAGAALLREYAAAQAAEAEAKARKETVKARVTALIGDAAEAVVDGQVAASWGNRTRVSCDHELLTRQWPEVAARVLTTKTYRQFTARMREEADGEQLPVAARRSAA